MTVDQAYRILYMIAAAVIGGLLVFVFLRTVLGPRIADRVVSVNLLGTLVTLLICILAYLMAEDYLVDISLIYTTLSFLAVVLLGLLPQLSDFLSR